MDLSALVSLWIVWVHDRVGPDGILYLYPPKSRVFSRSDTDVRQLRDDSPPGMVHSSMLAYTNFQNVLGKVQYVFTTSMARGVAFVGEMTSVGHGRVAG